ncbi:MAG: ATP-dependent helicase HrpB [Verrucomicrobiales bacterium]|nr:ATP-dependent helicase HrpB [Verrucomicrobiales bacterium]
MDPDSLPIYDSEEAIIKAFSGKGVVRLVLEAPTGSGKSTQIPKILLNNGLISKGQAVILQPRRVAARMLARRVAYERKGALGEEIGYQIRFEKVFGKSTKVRFVTEGILLRQFLDDPSLRGVDTIIFDEFHERHIHADVMLALAIRLQETTRKDLKIIVMSATLDSQKIAEYLDSCSVVRSEGRAYPVDVVHLNRNSVKEPLWDSIVNVFKKEIIKKNIEGDVLIFLPGVYDIRRTVERLRKVPKLKGCQILPLYGDLSPVDQDRALTKGETRKIVVSTNVAETSLTIDGVKIVIDSGLARIARFDKGRGINTLRIEKISQSSAQQRAGRAGRLCPGKCFRLWSESDHAAREIDLMPELLRLDLSEVLLLLLVADINAELDLKWVDFPSEESLRASLSMLTTLGAVEGGSNKVTEIGRRMAAYPVHPRFARMLLEALESECGAEAALCVALCQGRSLFIRSSLVESSEFCHPDDISDFQPMIRAWLFAFRAQFNFNKCDAYGINAKAAREAGAIMESLLNIARGQGYGIESLRSDCDGEALAKVLLVGFYDNLAVRMSEGTLSCNLVGSRRGKLTKGSVASSERIIVAAEVAEIEGKDVNVMISKATSIKMDWLKDVFSDEVKEEEVCRYDVGTKRVVGAQVTRFLDLELNSKSTQKFPHDQAGLVLANAVIEQDLKLKGWNSECDSWLRRVDCVRKNCPELGLPEFSEEDRRLVINEFCQGSSSYKEIKELNVWPFLKVWLSAEQRSFIERFAPKKITLSNGREIKIVYEEGGPKISIILQKLYDVMSVPKICNGKVPVLVEILGPNHRPVQRTEDLKGFWLSGYPEIKKQLRGRYPKHEWR